MPARSVCFVNACGEVRLGTHFPLSGCFSTWPSCVFFRPTVGFSLVDALGRQRHFAGCVTHVNRDLANFLCCGLGRFQTGFDKEPHGNNKPIHRITRPVLASVDLGDDAFEQRPDFSPDVRS